MSLPGGAASALLVAAASGTSTRANLEASGKCDGLPSFTPSETFQGGRKGMVFKLGDLGLGYYPDALQTLIAEVRPKLPEKWREVKLREERLRVDSKVGAGISMSHTDYGFGVSAVDEHPGQAVQAGDVIVAVEGRLFVGLSEPQMQASFLKRRAEGARLTVARFAEIDDLVTRDPNILESWDAANQRFYYFHKKTGQSGWTREELQAAAGGGATDGATASSSSAAPIDLANFLSHGFAKPREAPAKKRKHAETQSAKVVEKDESDRAREEKDRWTEWNKAGEKGRGGYTEMFLQKYRNCTSWVSDKKEDKRLKGSVGPGQGMEYMARWTGSKNSFN